MKSVEIKCNLRESLGKKDSKTLRIQEKIPCVLYGGKENVHFWAFERDFRQLIFTPNVYLIDLNIGGKVVNAIIQDIQYHPVSDRIIHVDFIQIFPDKKVIIEIPVQVNGVAAGVKDGGKLIVSMRKLKVRALPKYLPDVLDIDVTEVGLGKTIKVGDMVFPDIELVDPKNSVVVSVKLTRAARGAAGGEETADTTKDVKSAESTVTKA